MLVSDIFDQQTTVSSAAELRAVLNQRRGDGVNSFWLSHDGRDYPQLTLLLKGELASLTYFPSDGDAGYVPVGNLSALPTGEVAFSISAHEADDLFVVNDAVLPTSLAVKIAEEFLNSDALPTGLKWMHL